MGAVRTNRKRWITESVAIQWLIVNTRKDLLNCVQAAEKCG